ncbi:MAG: metallophosphoesterase [Candidatus Kerfeldbacteria bacterium]|nr:metallophosphoesterase [Candidatus Kerfeldbacteria bacterium]
MRFTTITSYYPYYLAGLFLALTLPVMADAYTVSGDGCFERAAGIIRLTEPTCTLAISVDTTEQVSLSFENVDPESVEVTSDDVVLTTTRTSTTLATSFTIATTATLTIAPWYEVSDDLWFVAMSDNQASGTVETNPIFEDMLPLISAINPVFITNAGDLIQGSSDDDTAHDMFMAVLATLEETTVPMFPTPGNHDHNSDLGIYESYFGEADYSYDYGPAHLIALSSSGSTSRGTVTTDQQAWLATELANTALQSIVYFHHPLSVPSWGKSTCCFEDTTERDDLAATLEAGGVDQVINGHSQGYDWRLLSTDDVSSLVVGLYQLISGGGGGNIAQPDGDYHFTLVHVTPTAVDHTVFELSDTNLVLDEKDNDGQSDQATITVEYSGAEHLPYIRFKFKLLDHDASYLVDDGFGSYLPHQSHVYGSERVLLATGSQNTGLSDRTYTAKVATTLHTGTDQTINSNGYVTFETAPEVSATDTGLSVYPDQLSTRITDLAQLDDGYSWSELPATQTVDTRYQLTNITPGWVGQVTVAGVLTKRLIIDEAGEGTFTLTNDAEQRDVVVQFTPAVALDEIFTLPASLGGAQVRVFNGRGANTNNWFAYDDVVGGYGLSYGHFTDLSAFDLLITRPDVAVVGLFSAESLVDSVTSTGAVHAADVRGTHYDELIVEQANTLRTYRLSFNQGQLIPLDSVRVPAHRLLDWAIVADQLVVALRSGQRASLHVYQWDDGWVRQQQRSIARHGRSVRLTQLNDTVAVVTDRMTIYDLQLNRLAHKRLRSAATVDQVLSGRFTPGVFDTIFLLQRGTIYPYVSRLNNRLVALPKIKAAASIISPVQLSDRSYQSLITSSVSTPPYLSLYHYDRSTKALRLRYQWSAYGDTFPGSATLALP